MPPARWCSASDCRSLHITSFRLARNDSGPPRSAQGPPSSRSWRGPGEELQGALDRALRNLQQSGDLGVAQPNEKLELHDLGLCGVETAQFVQRFVYLEQALPVAGRLRAELDYRQPIDRDDELELAAFGDCVAFLAGDVVKAVARAGAT